MPELQANLAFYRALREWKPRVGDAVIWHGWLTHWYGVVNQVQPSGHVSIIAAGLPLLLLTMDQDTMQKRARCVHASRIQSSRGGEWSVLQVVDNQMVWFV
jgi:hypothetical protein